MFCPPRFLSGVRPLSQAGGSFTAPAAFCIAATVVVALLSGGCKKSDATPPAPTSPDATTSVAEAAPPAPAPGVAAPAAPSQAAGPSPDVAAPPTAPSAPTEAPDAGPAAEAPPELSDVVPPRELREARQLCLRACNKLQQCGMGGDTVSGCYAACKEAVDAQSDSSKQADPEAAKALQVHVARFRALEACADSPCTAFKGCAEANAPLEEAYLASPPLSPKASAGVCEASCALEERCEPEVFKMRSSGKAGCEASCRVSVESPELRLAPDRRLHLARVGCKDVACDALQACVDKAVPPTPPRAEAPSPTKTDVAP